MEILWLFFVQYFVLQMTQGEVVNSALNKPAEMISKYRSSDNPTYNYSAANAVDGNTNTINPNIIHTAAEPSSAWWKVDLETLVQDATVKIYFRTDNKERRKIQLYTSTTPFSSYPGTESQRCYNYTSPVPDVLSVNCTGTWRYILVYTGQDGGGATILDFAEVQVLVCSNGTYDTECIKLCDSRQCAETPTSCDRYTWECPSGRCKAGWMGPDCILVCSNGTYGDKCNKTCVSRQCAVMSTICDHITGACSPGGCKPGWRGDDCFQGCSSGTYGPNCSSICGNCTNICDHVTGSCGGRCKPGWKGVMCLQIKEPSTDSPVIPAVAGAIAAILVIVVIVIFIVIFRRRRNAASSKKQQESESQSAVQMDKLPVPRSINKEGGNDYFNVKLEKHDVNERKKQPPTPAKQSQPQAIGDPELEEEDLEEEKPSPNRDYYNDADDVLGDIPVEDLAATVQKVKQREFGFEAEYNHLPSGFTASYDDSQKAENAGKNKFRGYYPYDHNRIRLAKIPDVPGSDYINASLMHVSIEYKMSPRKTLYKQLLEKCFPKCC